MSKSLESQVWQSALASELKPIAAVMADMGNDDGLGIYPSVEYLAWLLSCSERSAQRSLKKLVKMGVLDRIANAAGGRGLTPRYKLSANDLPKRPSWQETRKGDTLAPFPEKGDICDMKRVTFATVKGDKLSPDPLVDPLVEPPPLPPKGKSFKSGPKIQSVNHVELMVFLSVQCGGTLPHRAKESCSLTWLLENHAQQDILECFNHLKSQEWRETAVTWQTVQKEIGQYIQRRDNPSNGAKVERTRTIREKLGITLPDPSAAFITE